MNETPQQTERAVSTPSSDSTASPPAPDAHTSADADGAQRAKPDLTEGVFRTNDAGSVTEPLPAAASTVGANGAASSEDDTPSTSAEPDAEPDAAAAAVTSDDAAAGPTPQTVEEPSPAAATDGAEGATTIPQASATSSEAGDPGAGDAANKKPAARAQRPWAASLYRSYRTRRPIDGKVERVIKGGFEIRVGKARGFCPQSQIAIDRVPDAEKLVGQTMSFRITQLRRGGEDVVLSRRALLEEERREEAKAVRATLIEGSVMLGRVAGLAPFGAFVDLGAGVMGLVHVSELAHGRVPRVDQAVKVGEPVNVKVLKVDGERDRISLSLRQAQSDPWEGAASRFEVGSCYPGKVVRLADFGAFVALEPGLEALAPAVELPPNRAGWKEGLEPGVERDWLVLAVDAAQRRLTVVTAPEEGSAAATDVSEGATLNGKVQRVEKFGVFVWLGPGRVGLMPAALSGAPRGTDLARAFPVADPVEVDVLEIADDGRRIRLARKGVQAEQAGRAAEPRRSSPGRSARPSRPSRSREPRPDGPTQTSTTDSPFGSLLAEKLRAALDSGEQPS